jgi:RsmE family RNA methyltransferase
MNLILFQADELDNGLTSGDRRIKHIRQVLRCGPDDWFDIGIENGPRGKARMKLDEGGQASFEYKLGVEPPGLFPLTVLVGMPRPQTARRLLREMTSLGVEKLWFASTDRSEKGYAASKLWTTSEFKRHVRQGAEQAFCTRLPEVRRFDSIREAVQALDVEADRVALDNYESELALVDWSPASERAVLALGAERGWSAEERTLLRGTGFALADLGDRVLRVETAAIAAVTLVLRPGLRS